MNMYVLLSYLTHSYYRDFYRRERVQQYYFPYYIATFKISWCPCITCLANPLSLF